MMQNRQGMGEQLSEGLSPGQGSGGLGQQLQQQIEDMKKQLGYGQALGGGKASTGWGLGTSPYAVEPAPADPNSQVEERQGDKSLGDTQPIDYEQLYAAEDNAHGFTSENQLHGDLDMTAAPDKIEEVRTAPETQAALLEFADIIGTYVEGEESAINREQVPLEYHELVRAYFEQLARRSQAGAGTAAGGDSAGGEGTAEGDGTAESDG